MSGLQIRRERRVWQRQKIICHEWNEQRIYLMNYERNANHIFTGSEGHFPERGLFWEFPMKPVLVR